jgi:hypothetical protein
MQVVNPTSSSSVLEWIRGRAAADEQMRRAGAARTAAPAPPREGEEAADVADVLTRDHNQVTNLLKQLATIPGAKKGGSPARMSARKSIVDMITMHLSGHVTAEQRHLWPTVREALDDGDELAEQALEMNSHGDDVLTALGKLDGTEEEFDDLVEELSLASRKHVAFEAPVFMRLREAVDRDTLLELGQQVAHARDHGPTRPHPHAPERQPGVGLAAPAGAVMDHARDALGSRPADRQGTADGAAVEQSAESSEGDQG